MTAALTPPLGARPVYFHKGRESPKKYGAYIGASGDKGRDYFLTLEEAVAARKVWEERLSLAGIL
jgi:hypothetical protein